MSASHISATLACTVFAFREKDVIAELCAISKKNPEFYGFKKKRTLTRLGRKTGIPVFSLSLCVWLSHSSGDG
jgi:hypothetical protein